MSVTTHVRPHHLLALAAVAAVAGVVTAASGSAAAPVAPRADVQHFRVLFSPQDVIDVPPSQTASSGPQPGDYAVFSDQLVDGHGHPVGTEGGSGLITRVDSKGAQIYFSLAVQLPDGQVTAQGLASAAPAKTVAVTGGTGRYTGASGRLHLIENRDNTGTLTLTLRSPRHHTAASTR